MSRVKKSKFRDSYASIGSKDFFGTMYDGMCRSDAYKRLSLGAKHFYMLCRVQSQSSHGKSCLYKHSNEYGIAYGENCFVFPASHLNMYGCDRSNAVRYFDELEQAGFIKRLEKNQVRKKVNVYAFSDRWKNSS